MAEEDDDDDDDLLGGWSFSVSLGQQEQKNHEPAVSDDCDVHVPRTVRAKFERDGFAVFPNVLSQSDVDALNDRLEDVLRGEYDRGGIPPDKSPRLLKLPKSESSSLGCPNGSSKNNRQGGGKTPAASTPTTTTKRKVLQIINIHKSDTRFRELACSGALGSVVAQLAGWTGEEQGGARLAQDQVWAKPPGAPPLAYHRDTPYFMFEPDGVVTAWVALDDMDDELGPLRYVPGSHKWGDARVGSANVFFADNGGTALLRSAAEREGVIENVDDGTGDGELPIVSVAGLKAGGVSIHDGRTWHGSGWNRSATRPRRGLGLHFVPASARFTEEAAKSRLWGPYVVAGAATTGSNSGDDGANAAAARDVASIPLPEEDFPITWKPS